MIDIPCFSKINEENSVKFQCKLLSSEKTFDQFPELKLAQIDLTGKK